MQKWFKFHYTPILLIIVVLLHTGMLGTGSAAGLTIDAQRQLGFARQLLENQQYRRAAEEFQRFAFFYDEHPERRGALLEAGKALLLADDPRFAQVPLKALIADERLDPLAVEAHFLLAASYLQMRAPSHAVVRLSNLIALSDDIAVDDRAYSRIGWIQIEALDWRGALRAFKRISDDGRKRFNIPELEAAVVGADEIPQKSPALAGILSFIPGGGQLYCGRYQDAAVALASNVALFWSALDAFDSDQNALGGLLTLIGVGFYAGNIYGAVNDAHKFNANQKRRYGDRLRRTYSQPIEPLSHDVRQDTLIGFRVSF